MVPPALQQTVADLIDNNVRIVVGLRVDPRTDVIQPSLDFPGRPNGRKVIEGDLTLDEDERRVPLVWTDHTADQKTVTVETLSLKGALARTPELRRKNKRLD